jgi:tetratricopeptide (TPR) repeat protein
MRILYGMILCTALWAPAVAHETDPDIQVCLHSVDNFEQQIKVCKKLVERMTRYIEATTGDFPPPSQLSIRAQAYFKLGDFDHVIEDTTRVIGEMPGNAVPYFLRAKAHYWKFEYLEAFEDVQSSIERDPSEAEAFVLRSEIYRELDMHLGEDRRSHYCTLAKADLEKALKLSKKSAEARNLLEDANVYWCRGY